MDATTINGKENCDAGLRTGTSHGLVATAFPSATEAAAHMLRRGGNAVDAAVAAALALTVCEPSGSGLGGKTVVLIRFPNGRSIMLDGRSPAPAAVSRKQITRAQQRTGYRACTVPSTVAVLAQAQRCYGRLPFHQVVEPAIHLAAEGFPVTPLYCRQLKWCRVSLRASRVARRLFLKKGSLLKKGEVFRQPILAATLRRLAKAGPEDFYTGQVARDMVADMAMHNGLLTLRDLAECARPLEVEPLTAAYRGNTIMSAPPPGGGVAVLLALKILERFSMDELCHDADWWYETLAKVIHAVLREHVQWPIAPEQLTASLRNWMLGAERTAEIFDHLDCLPSEWPADVECEDEAGETTHLCTADSRGTVVSLTQSLQSLFGAKVASEKLGFFYNNCLSTCPRHSHPYQLASRCLPRSNMAPTIVLRSPAVALNPIKDAPEPAHGSVLALGAAGSRRIISSIVQVISNVLDRKMSLADAVNRPRIHVMLSGKAHIEKPVATPVLQGQLAGRYRELRIRARQSYFMGAVQAIQTGADEESQAAADPRRDGTAMKVEA